MITLQISAVWLKLVRMQKAFNPMECSNKQFIRPC